MFKAEKNKGADDEVKVAVADISLAIPAGELFVLLGTNGAGKTTLLSVCTASLAASRGDMFLSGFHCGRESNAMFGHLGYTPQFDVLLPEVTVREHLLIFARLKGVPEAEVEQLVDRTLSTMSLRGHADKRSKDLSGGNKRKLSAGIALIGAPDVTILDEPSTGMDAQARRFMWNVLKAQSSASSGRSMIVTTHLMEEAEALGARIGIMVAGRLEVVGSPLHLKNKYGTGFVLELTSPEERSDEIEEWVHQAFPSSRLSERVAGQLKFDIGGTGFAQIFSKLEQERERLEIKFYAVAQCSLEQIFLRLARGDRWMDMSHDQTAATSNGLPKSLV